MHPGAQGHLPQGLLLACMLAGALLAHAGPCLYDATESKCMPNVADFFSNNPGGDTPTIKWVEKIQVRPWCLRDQGLSGNQRKSQTVHSGERLC